ncbi:hypothetical protein PENPOL_c003G01088 [Penicillium polonicum]|uniref:Uncharacterized protein n=1 Tax=Penicillium polonicum TaxID=60169 RepID=A0A1V6NT09_PENPO|nr:hypothetical protein PENPOL_c003G01088 [Penicillium polonicum]
MPTTFASASNFTANNCPLANSQNVGELGAGVIADDAYHFFSSKGMDDTRGYEQSVGLAGGFAQGGSAGSFTTTYDGEIRIINQCNESELFRAMRGGGGGAFAVLTKYGVQLYPSLPIHTYTFTANFTGDTSEATQNVVLHEILTAHAENQDEWSAQLVTGQLEYFPERIVISMVLLYGDNGSELRSASASFAVSLSNRTDLSLRMNIPLTLTMPTISPSLLPMPRSRNRRGSSPYWHRAWFPAQRSMPLETIDELVEGVIQGIAIGRSHLNLTGTQIALETPVSNLDENQMSPAHLAWRDALCYSCY